MTKVHIGHGRWFNADTATVFQGARVRALREGKERNYAKESGEQHKHEQLISTARGTKILCTYHDYGTDDYTGHRMYTYKIVSEHEAHHWLIENDHPSDFNDSLEL